MALPESPAVVAAPEHRKRLIVFWVMTALAAISLLKVIHDTKSLFLSSFRGQHLCENWLCPRTDTQPQPPDVAGEKPSIYYCPEHHPVLDQAPWSWIVTILNIALAPQQSARVFNGAVDGLAWAMIPLWILISLALFAKPSNKPPSGA